ncbi:MAG: diaminopimelate epimerase [Chloroflexi bacterium]|nr:diaminopimelate epimerase [Chloroflexota bacterium]
MIINFTKLQGAGNGYIAIDGRDINLSLGDLSKKIGDPKFGVGSDGIVVVENSQSASIKMRVFNTDGSEAEMSGNGIRLFSKFIIDNKICLPENNTLNIETLGGIRTVWPKIVDGKMISGKVAMGKPNFNPNEIPVDVNQIENNPVIENHLLSINHPEFSEIKITCLSIGNPHAVCILDTPVEDFPLNEIGPIIENHKIFPNRINFEIVNIIDDKKIRARIFERGEGETLSSGTGSTASACAARKLGFIKDAVEVILDGGILKISWDNDGEAYLEGPTEEVFTGNWEIKN